MQPNNMPHSRHVVQPLISAHEEVRAGSWGWEAVVWKDAPCSWEPVPGSRWCLVSDEHVL